jgi:hypothetical protein
MFKTAVSKVAWVGRTVSMVLGLALVMALVFGVASMALGATGDNFLLGKKNVADAISTLVKKGPGPALSLVVEANQPPLKVKSKAKVANLNADTVDGKDSGQLKGAAAYARVNPFTLSLDPNRTSGFTAVSRVADGNYCLTPVSGVNPADHPAVVSVDWASTLSLDSITEVSYNSNGCGDGRFQVVTERQSVSNGVLVEQPANDIGFVIVVP